MHRCLAMQPTHRLLPDTALCVPVAAFAGHTIVSNLYPWNQGKYDTLLAKQLSDVSAADRRKAEGIAVPIAVKLLRERCGGRMTTVE